MSPNRGECVKFLKEKGIETTKEKVENFYKNEILIKEILRDMDKVGRSNDLKGFEIPKGVYLTAEKFSIENTKRGQSEDRQLFHLLQESKSTSQDQPLLSFKSDPSPSQMENNVSTDSDSLQQEIHSLRQRHL